VVPEDEPPPRPRPAPWPPSTRTPPGSVWRSVLPVVGPWPDDPLLAVIAGRDELW